MAILSNPHLSATDLVASLIDDIANRVAERLSDVVLDSERPAELLDEPAMADSLGVSQQTLERLRKQGKVPCVRLGRRVLYRPEAVLEALSETATGGPEE